MSDWLNLSTSTCEQSGTVPSRQLALDCVGKNAVVTVALTAGQREQCSGGPDELSKNSIILILVGWESPTLRCFTQKCQYSTKIRAEGPTHTRMSTMSMTAGSGKVKSTEMWSGVRSSKVKPGRTSTMLVGSEIPEFNTWRWATWRGVRFEYRYCDTAS